MYTWILPLHFFFSFPKDPLLWAPPAGWILCWPAYRSIQPPKGGYFFCCCLITVISLSFIHPYSLFIHKLHKYICAILPLPWRRYIHHKKKERRESFLPSPFFPIFSRWKFPCACYTQDNVAQSQECCSPVTKMNASFFSPKLFFWNKKKKLRIYCID